MQCRVKCIGKGKEGRKEGRGEKGRKQEVVDWVLRCAVYIVQEGVRK